MKSPKEPISKAGERLKNVVCVCVWTVVVMVVAEGQVDSIKALMVTVKKIICLYHSNMKHWVLSLNLHLEFLSVSYFFTTTLAKTCFKKTIIHLLRNCCALAIWMAILWLGLPGSLIWLQSSGSTAEAGGPHSHVCRLVLPVGCEWSLILTEAGPGFLVWCCQGSKSLRAEAERPSEVKALTSYDVPFAAYYWLTQVTGPTYTQGEGK